MQLYIVFIIALAVATYNGVIVPVWIWALLGVIVFFGTIGITVKTIVNK